MPRREVEWWEWIGASSVRGNSRSRSAGPVVCLSMVKGWGNWRKKQGSVGVWPKWP